MGASTIMFMRKFIAMGLAATFAVTTVAPAAASPLTGSGATTWADIATSGKGASVIKVHRTRRRHRHRRAKTGAIIAGAAVLGILGIAAAAAHKNRRYEDDYYVDYDDRNARRNWRACQRAVKRELRRDGGYRIRVRNPDEIVYLSRGKHRIFGRARARGIGRVEYRCTAKRGRVRRLRIY